MNAHRRTWLVAGLVMIGVGFLLVGGAAKSAAETVGPTCSTGKPICASLTSDADPTSRSPVGNDHYMAYSVEVSYNTASGASSNLTNMTVTVGWADLGVPATTSAYVAAQSDPRCTVTAPLTLTCAPTPKSLGPGSSPFGFGPLIFRTSTTTPDNPTDAEATGTDVFVTASASETPKPPKGGTNVSFVTVHNATSYENVGDRDLSIAGAGLSPTLVTTNAGLVNQIAKLPVSASAPRGLFKVEEENYAGSVTCPVGLVCFGQHVTTTTITGTSPVNLQIVFEGDKPGNEADLGVFHQRNDGTLVLIDDMCPSATPTLAEITASNGCLTQRTMTTIPSSGGDVHIELSAWDINNGGWGGIT
jgi:hypothetical protein